MSAAFTANTVVLHSRQWSCGHASEHLKPCASDRYKYYYNVSLVNKHPDWCWIKMLRLMSECERSRAGSSGHHLQRAALSRICKWRQQLRSKRCCCQALCKQPDWISEQCTVRLRLWESMGWGRGRAWKQQQILCALWSSHSIIMRGCTITGKKKNSLKCHKEQERTVVEQSPKKNSTSLMNFTVQCSWVTSHTSRCTAGLMFTSPTIIHTEQQHSNINSTRNRTLY